MKTSALGRKNAVRLFLTLFCASLTGVAQAGSITNNFTSGADYVANGVVGTMWDGAYLGLGDLPGGGNGGDGNGSTAVANESSFSGFLTVQSTGTSWSAGGDDGFYLWKIVYGDFDVSVKNANPYENPNYHFAGLLARAYTTNGPLWGQPLSITSTNAYENWVNITRFNEFSVGDQIRYATNGGSGAGDDIQIAAPFNSGSTNYNTETNDDRYLRITRVGDTFTFYDKTNQSDGWVLETNIARPDLHGLPMQVGIEDATFGSATPTTFWTDFELSGTNVASGPTPPTDPTGLTSSAPNPSVGGITLSWTPGSGSAGSVVIVRQNNPALLQVPNNSFVYNGNTAVGTGDRLSGGATVVYVGSGNSVNITGLQGANNTYYAWVFSYSGSGSSIVYGTNPATANFVGTAAVTNITLSVGSTNLPTGGATPITAIAYFGTGGSLDISTDPSATWNSTAPGVAFAGNGSISGGTNVGSATISVTYNSFASPTNVTVQVHTPAFTDNFTSAHNYLAVGLPGSTWDGVYYGANDFVGENPAGATTSTNDADISNTNELTLAAANSAWEGAGDNGPFLFKNVNGGADFQVAVHIHSYNQTAYNFAGLMARSANPNGSPIAAGESHVNLWRFDQFGVTTSVRRTRASTLFQVIDQTDGESTDFWLLMTRSSGGTFHFFKRSTTIEPWHAIPNTVITRADLANVSMQVGLAQAVYTPNVGWVQFDNFMLDATNVGTGTPPASPAGTPTLVNNPNGTMTLNWTNAPGSVGSIVVMHANGPVTAQPDFGVTYTANSQFGLGTDLGGGNFVVYIGGGTTVTVDGLANDTTYYATVYSYSGSGGTISYNTTGASQQTIIATNPVVSVNMVLPQGNTIANGGILPFTAEGVYTDGTSNDLSGLVTITCSPTNTIVGTNGLLTALTNGAVGPITVYDIASPTVSNSVVVTARDPSFSDNFTTSHDYIANGVTGTPWSGVYGYPNYKIPGSSFVSDAAANVSAANANVTSNGVLTVTSENVGWENAQNDGFFLFKYVPGDFQMAVHITTPLLDTNGNAVAYNYPGLMARAYSFTNGIIGAPIDGATGEDWVTWSRFDEFNIGTRAELIIDNGTTAQPTSDQGSDQRWLLMIRHNSTSFTFYQRSNATDPWQPSKAKQSFSVANLAGLPVQAGIQEGGFDSGNVVVGQFDHFMLDVSPSAGALTATPAGPNVLISWPAVPGGSYTLRSSTSLAPANWQPVLGSPVFTNGFNIMTVPISGSTEFFRLSSP